MVKTLPWNVGANASQIIVSLLSMITSSFNLCMSGLADLTCSSCLSIKLSSTSTLEEVCVLKVGDKKAGRRLFNVEHYF